MTSPPLLAVDRLAKRYALPRQRLFARAPTVEALRGVSLVVEAGASLGLVGESGSGKSTLARLVMALERPSSGRVVLLGRDLNALSPRGLQAARRDFQMVFQDPYGSLDPRQRVGRIVAEPLDALAPADARTRVAESLDAVGLRAADADKYPHEFSGGQRQRIAIARALITRPRLIVADEPVSALDVSVQAQVLNLLLDLQQQFGVTYLFISHDLAVVDHLCAEVAVMYAGRIVEQGTPDLLFRHAAHPYTQALIAAVPEQGFGGALSTRRASGLPVSAPVGSRAGAAVLGSGAGAVLPSSGCAYAPRCAYRTRRCLDEDPALRPVGSKHQAACHHAEAVLSGAPLASGIER